MAKKDLESLKVIICGRSYPLKVKEEDVDTLQQIVKQINQKVKEFQLTFSKRDLQDCMAMVLLTYAVDLHKRQHQGESEELTSRIVDLDAYLDQLIRNKYAAS